MFRLRIGKWFFSYLEYIIAILVTLGLYLLIDFIKPLPSWLLVLPLVIALIVRNARDKVKGEKEKLVKLANSVDELTKQFSGFAKCSELYSVCSIATDLLSKYRGESDKIKGWVAYFDKDWGMPARLFESYGSFEDRWRKYTENPKGEKEFFGLIREFLNLLGLHYNMHSNLRELLRDINDWGFLYRYNEFKKEYDEFSRYLRRVAPALKEVIGVDIKGTFYYGFAESLD